MKQIRNKKTGEILIINDEWEDYEEPKEWWFIDYTGSIKHGEGLFNEKSYIKDIQLIGNYFSSKEEAEKAVERIKAWQRLKDLGTEILGWETRDMPTGGDWQTVNVKLNVKARKEPMSLLDLLFEGEE